MRNTVNDFCYPVNKEEKKWILFGFDLEGIYYNVPYDSRKNAELAMEEGKKTISLFSLGYNRNQ